MYFLLPASNFSLCRTVTSLHASYLYLQWTIIITDWHSKTQVKKNRNCNPTKVILSLNKMTICCFYNSNNWMTDNLALKKKKKDSGTNLQPSTSSHMKNTGSSEEPVTVSGWRFPQLMLSHIPHKLHLTCNIRKPNMVLVSNWISMQLLKTILNYHPLQHDTLHQFADAGYSLQMWRVVANIFNKLW